VVVLRKRIDRKEIYRVIEKYWPVHVSEVAEQLNIFPKDKKGQKKILSLLRYHFDQLQKQDKIRIKKIGRSVVAWPVEIEKLRVIHELLKS
jgi:predicted transcriptional regulator